MDAAIAVYLAAEDEGRPLGREAFLGAYPDLLDELDAFLNDHGRLAGLAGVFPFKEVTGEKGERTAEYRGPSGRGEGIAPGVSEGLVLDGYEVVEEIARGGMGVVYRAWQGGLNREVALKMILGGPLASEDEVRRFRGEAAAVAELDHPNIVPVYEVGQSGAQHYFSMKLMSGGSLADRVRAGPTDAREAAELTATVARAVHHAHQRGILHRDLKPSNILLDAEGRPHVSDFGLAQRIDAVGELTATGAIVGSPSYMAPEQAEGGKGVTTATDVYGLGAILYALLAGRPPFRAESALETIRQVRECPPEPPGVATRRIDRDLETICLKCLSKGPADRYASADGLARDLERWLRGEPIQARRVSGLRRLELWWRRHPVTALLGSLGILGLVLASVAALLLARVREEMLVREVGQSNLYGARHVASTVLRELEELGRPVASAARDPALRELLERGDRGGLQRYLERLGQDVRERERGQLGAQAESTYESWFVLDERGTMCGVWPQLHSIIGRDYRQRDYFQGAMSHGERPGASPVHVSRVFRAENDDLNKFAMSAVVREEGEGRVVGVLAVTITTRAALGPIRLDDQQRIAVLLGWADTHGPRPGVDAAQVETLKILRHPAYRRGDEAISVPLGWLSVVPSRGAGESCAGDEFALGDSTEGIGTEGVIDLDARDPMGVSHPKYAGRWVLGVASVGRTELVVAVQRRYDEAVGTDRWLTLGMGMGMASALGLALLLAGTAGVRWLRRGG